MLNDSGVIANFGMNLLLVIAGLDFYLFRYRFWMLVWFYIFHYQFLRTNLQWRFLLKRKYLIGFLNCKYFKNYVGFWGFWQYTLE